MNSLFATFHSIFSAGVATMGLIMSSVISHPATHHVQQPVQERQAISITQQVLTPTDTPTPTQEVTATTAPKVITVQKTIVAMGKHVTMYLSIPEDGGKIDGSVVGDCQGALDGTYTPTTYTIDGKGEITCTVGFLSLPANASFTGLVHPDKKTVDINYSVISGSNFSKSGKVTVPYTEK